MKLNLNIAIKGKNLKNCLFSLAIIICCLSLLTAWITYTIALDNISVTADGQKTEYKTIKTTVAEVLSERGIVLKPGDRVIPGLKSQITENLHIEVIRSFPVTIKTFRRTFKFYTVEQPVKEVLTRAKVAYDHDDKITPALDEIIKPGGQIEIVKVTSTILTTQIILPASTEYRRDNRLEKGTRRILQSAQNGVVERQVKVIYENGQERKRITLGDKVIKPKINAIIALGIKPIVRVLKTSRGSYRYLEVKNMDATAYSPGPESCGIYAKYGRTFTGKKAGFGIVAVDRRVIPLGTKLYIEGYGKAEAADIGAAIKGNRIDLCFETYREAVMFGRKKVKVYILTE